MLDDIAVVFLPRRLKDAFDDDAIVEAKAGGRKGWGIQFLGTTIGGSLSCRPHQLFKAIPLYNVHTNHLFYSNTPLYITMYT